MRPRAARVLARYAAEHLTTHAQFGEVSPRLQKGIRYLVDLDKPHFKAWLTIYDIDTEPPDYSTFYEFTPCCKSPATPLYYAALCGFHDLVEHLIVKNPQDVNADGDYYVRPLVAAWQGNTSRRQTYSVITAQTQMSGADMGEIHCMPQPFLEISRWSGY
jgi:hypothetical protein